jgi:hypothetical protein
LYRRADLARMGRPNRHVEGISSLAHAEIEGHGGLDGKTLRGQLRNRKVSDDLSPALNGCQVVHAGGDVGERRNRSGDVSASGGQKRGQQ